VKVPIWFSAGLITASVATATAKPQNASHGLSPAEEWVVTQVMAGEIADLSKRFGDEAKRKLNAHFLEDLLTGTFPGVKPRRNGVRISGATIDEPIDLTNAQISCEVWLDHCQFKRPVTFQQASLTGKVTFYDSTFKADANFSRMKVGHIAVFDKAVFEGLANFNFANIVGNFEAVEAQFKNMEQGATFNSLKVGHSAFFEKTVFEGPVNFGSADIASDFRATESQFQNTEQGATFNSIKVGHVAFFEKALFEGPVDFNGADIVSQFAAQEAQFKNKEKSAGFDAMKVGDAAFFKNAVFEGPVNFTFANIASNFDAEGAQFKNKEEGAIFNGMKVGHSAHFQSAVFEGAVDFGSADIASEFGAQRAKFQNKEKGASFDGMKVGGAALFNDAVFEGPVTFINAEFGWLDLSSPFWPKVAAQLNMQGMSYKYIRAVPENEPESHKALLKLADRSAYTADVYSHLEEFFLRQGYRDDADRAFIAGKRRERKEHLYGLGWLGSLLLDGLVGYGRRPWQAAIPCAVLVALGCVLFSPKKMEQQKPEDAPRVYSRFWYSLGLFLPFVDLQADKVWKPKNDQRFLRHYMRLHILLGWILIPILLAAISGLIK
jgi:hypothetical protein